MMKNYQELIVWQKSMRLVHEVYSLIRELPKEERFALGAQMRRCVVSIPSNIAEGHGRHSTQEYIHFLHVARGSLYELETQLFICMDQAYFSQAQTQASFSLCEEVGRLLNALIGRLA